MLDKDFNYEVFMIDGVAYLPIHHPSFVLIYRRRNLESYISQICRAIHENLNCKAPLQGYDNHVYARGGKGMTGHSILAGQK
jgi:hypothetical protein